jgi:hypothetical protein
LPVRGVPALPVPFAGSTKVHTPMKSCPLRVRRSSSACRPVGRRFDSPRSSVPSTASPGLAPRWSGSSVSTPVPLSGFLNLSAVSWHTQASWPCFMPQPFLGSSLQSSSPTRIAHPSRGRWLPCSYPPACVKRAGPRRSPPVSPTSTPSRSCLVPRTTMDSLSVSERPPPGRPGLGSAKPLRSASFTYFEAFFPS